MTKTKKSIILYHGTSLKNAQSLLKNKVIDDTKFGSKGAKNRKESGLLGRGLYLTPSVLIASSFADKGKILKFTLSDNLLDIRDFVKTKKIIKKWFLNYLNAKRAANKRPPMTKKQTDEIIDDIKTEYDADYVQYVNDYAKEHNFYGVIHSGDIVVIWDNAAIKNIEEFKE